MKRNISRLLQPGIIWYSIIMLVFALAAFIAKQYYLGAAEFVVTVLIFTISRIRFVRRKRMLMDYVQSATDSVGVSVHAGSPFPMAVVHLPENEIIWGNPAFYQITGLADTSRYQTMESVVPGFNGNWLREGRTEFPGDQTINGRRYRIYGNYVRSEEDEMTVMLATVYFADMTEMFNIRDEFLRTRPIVSIALIDNYDELTNNLPDSAIMNLDAQINETILQWLSNRQALCRKVERNRYLLVFENKDLVQLQNEKFTLLDSIRTVTNSSGIAATISLGIGKDGSSFEENYNFALLSIEMSLSRGGDQAVIKDRYNFSFYGGRTKETERRTKVKSRVIAGSLSELISQSSQVFIMGHRMADLDAVGAAVGLHALCRKKGKPSRIVLDMQNNYAKNLVQELQSHFEYGNLFISGDDALVEADAHSLLIVVDTNRPDQVESKALLESIPRVAVIDHHRRAADYIEQVVLNLHEPFSSSAAELVTEVLQYALDPKDIRPIEALSLLAGIVLDTKNFTVRTSARTFEAAAFLRRTGADTVDVKKLFQNDLDDTIARYNVIQAARLYRNEIAIASIDHTVTRTIAAQAADELLNISGIRTSFVLYPETEQIVICARSIGECNVQLVLEPLGGGGNAAAAGAQLKGAQLRTVLSNLVQSIDKFFET
ncbi:MAG: DHH family phosphoesterase [Oscillospiraceae bacterium]|nr:DHH family phosphoesterase [Oscillospiraceae bacterium]